MGNNRNIIGHIRAMTLYPSLLVSSVASGALMEISEISRQNKIMRIALDKIACWHDGFDVDGAFDEPSSAHIARMAIGKCEEVCE